MQQAISLDQLQKIIGKLVFNYEMQISTLEQMIQQLQQQNADKQSNTDSVASAE